MIAENILDSYNSFSNFSKKSGISRGALSLIFKKPKPKPISFDQLVKITTTLGYPEEHFFNLYIETYFVEGSFNRSRIESLLDRCGELELMQHLEKALRLLESTPYYIPIIFEVAERLHETNKKNAALFIYNWITAHTSEISQEMLSICHYRIFRCGLLLDSDNNLQLLYRLLPFKLNLPPHLKLETLLNATDILHHQQRYEDQDILAEELISLCVELFGTEQNANHKSIALYKDILERHPVVYYGRGYLLKYAYLESTQQYEKAQEYVKAYGSLYWFDDDTEIAKAEIEKFAIFAKANVWNLELLQGNTSVLPEYSAFLDDHPLEILPSFISVLTAANDLGFLIDEFLDKFETRLTEGLADPHNYYSESTKRNNHSYALYHLAIYYFNIGQVEKSLSAAIECWRMSSVVNNEQHVKLLASLTLLYNTCSLENTHAERE
ncbi:hypothetical protein CDO73_23985 [Saccharibacillus sp. O23]|uniref:hypothetical protein n=1 Tax=Saccharibacillus sp. O23 TaxID=2009338 RepID=UPI000B4DF501|nr:hypothetical protein [Saccharibacillus sp. O23]OWR26968.1 hypothetical protein CDO73_23985 [Saccharibacillus sp. O23]